MLIFIYSSISFAAQKYIFLCKPPSLFRENLIKEIRIALILSDKSTAFTLQFHCFYIVIALLLQVAFLKYLGRLQSVAFAKE